MRKLIGWRSPRRLDFVAPLALGVVSYVLLLAVRAPTEQIPATKILTGTLVGLILGLLVNSTRPRDGRGKSGLSGPIKLILVGAAASLTLIILTAGVPIDFMLAATGSLNLAIAAGDATGRWILEPRVKFEEPPEVNESSNALNGE